MPPPLWFPIESVVQGILVTGAAVLSRDLLSITVNGIDQRKQTKLDKQKEKDKDEQRLLNFRKTKGQFENTEKVLTLNNQQVLLSAYRNKRSLLSTYIVDNRLLCPVLFESGKVPNNCDEMHV